ncbi:MAG TPA: DUF2111 domain-containing protein [Methanocellaceae archaeon]|jgi:hypothetical protein
MDMLRISSDASGSDLAPLAMSIHHITGHMPVVIKGKNKRGIIVEDGLISDSFYESRALNAIFEGKNCACLKPEGGRHAGLPMFASAITDKNGKKIAAVGIIDTTGLLQMKTFIDIRAHLEKQLNI